MLYFAVLIPIVIAVFPLFGSRFIPTHDGEYHIIRFWEFYTMLHGGNWFPRWAPHLNNGFGIPLFTFQYPFPNYVGSAFHVLGLSFVDSVKWTLGSGYLIALAFCFLWVRQTYGRIPALIATLTCAFVPYWFIDIYIRGSVGEVWAFAWVFGVLYAIASKQRLLVTVFTALCIVSHNITALICIPILFLYASIVHIQSVKNIILGIGAASYFWMPALYEQRYIRGLSQVNIFDYFPQIHQLLIPSWGSGFRGQTDGASEMSYQIGLIPLSLIIITGISFIRRKVDVGKEVVFAMSCVVIAMFLMTPWSMPLWRLVPLVHFIQYPWRLLSIVILMTPILAANTVVKYRFGWVVAVCAVLFSYGYSRPVTYEPRTDAHYLKLESLAKGTSSLGNAFQTQWFTQSGDAQALSFFLTSGDVSSSVLGPTTYGVTISSSEAGTLTAPLAYYPGWTLEMSELRKTATGSPNEKGLLTFQVPKGHYDAIVQLGMTPWQQIAGIMSILSLSVALVSFILKK